MPLSLPELIGGTLGGAVAKATSGPGKQAEESMNSILDILRTNPEQIDIWNARAGQGWDKAMEGLNRGRFYLDEAGASAREAPKYIQSAADTYDRAESAYQPGLDYVTKVLGGGATTMEAIAPEVTGLRNQYQQATQAASQFAPRGGGRAAVLSELPYRQASDVMDLFSQARRGAAELLPTYGQGITQIGAGRADLANVQANVAEVQRRIGATEGEFAQVAGQLGLNAGQLGILLQDVMTKGASAILNYDINNRRLIFEIVSAATKAGADAGSSLWGLLKKIGSWIFGGGVPTPEQVEAAKGRTTAASGGGSRSGDPWLNPDPFGNIDWTDQILYNEPGWYTDMVSEATTPSTPSVTSTFSPFGGQYTPISGSQVNNELPPNWNTMSVAEKNAWLQYYYGISP